MTLIRLMPLLAKPSARGQTIFELCGLGIKFKTGLIPYSVGKPFNRVVIVVGKNIFSVAQSAFYVFSFLFIHPCSAVEEAVPSLREPNQVLTANEAVSLREAPGENASENEDTFDKAQALVDKGQLAEAEPLFKKVLDNRKTILGERDWTKEVMVAIKNPSIRLPMLLELRNAYLIAQVANKFSLKKPQYPSVESAKSMKRKQDSEQPHLLRKLANMSMDFGEKPNYADCETLVKLDLASFEIIPDRLEAAKSLGTLGQIYYLQKRYEQSSEMFRDAATLYEEAYGKTSSDYLTCYNNIALNNLKQRKFIEAETQLKNSLQIIEQSKSTGLGDEEEMFLSNLLCLYTIQKRAEDAKSIAERLSVSQARKVIRSAK